MKFSVLMSVYAKEEPQYLEEAINSIVNQTLPPDEIVIVKDGPLTPELDKVIDDFEKNDIRFNIVQLDKNCGLGIALNKGMAACTYEVIARMDSDDMSLPDRFKTQITYMNNHPEVDIISANIAEFDENMEHQLSVREVPETDSEIKIFMKSRNPLNHMAVIYRKSAIESAGGYEDCPYFEDYYLWCRGAVNGSIFHNVQENLVNVRAGRGMLSRRGGLGYTRHIIDFQKKIHRIGIITRPKMVANIAVRSVTSIVPSSMRSLLYANILRREVGR